MEVKNCTDCENWNPDDPQNNYCDANHNPSVHDWMDEMSKLFGTPESETINCSDCPAFVEMYPQDAEQECSLCLGSGHVDDDECPECHGAGSFG